MKQLTAIELAEELFKIHHYEKFEGKAEYEIVYKEADIIALLQKLGLPAPDWEHFGKLMERELLSCPGDTIRETLKIRGISLKEFQKQLIDVNAGGFWTVHNVIDLISGELKIDDAIATELEHVLNVPKQFWLNLEQLYREKLAKINKQ